MRLSAKELEGKRTKLATRILDCIHRAQSGHVDSSLSVLDILMVLYYCILNIRPQQPEWPDRDRVVLSKGHAAPALYTILADLGYFPEGDLDFLRTPGSHLSGHPKRGTPGIETTSGSLGQGLSISAGMAYSNQYIHYRSNRVYAILSEGDLNEGQTWEAILFASHHKLSSLTMIIDRNGLQYTGLSDDILSLGDLTDKLDAFGWRTETCNGHDHEVLEEVLSKRTDDSRPTCLIASTTKGKGIPFMENRLDWHGKVPSGGQYEEAKREIIRYSYRVAP